MVHLIVTNGVLMTSRDFEEAIDGAGGLILGQRERQHTVVEFSPERGVVEGGPELQTEAVVALHGFEMQRLPIDAHDLGFARSHDEVRAADFDGDSGGLDSGDVNIEFHGIGLFATVIARLAVFRIDGISSGPAATLGRSELDNCVHGDGGMKQVRKTSELWLRASGFLN